MIFSQLVNQNQWDFLVPGTFTNNIHIYQSVAKEEDLVAMSVMFVLLLVSIRVFAIIPPRNAECFMMGHGGC